MNGHLPPRRRSAAPVSPHLSTRTHTHTHTHTHTGHLLVASLTSFQRILTKGRTAPAPVAPAAGESILKPHFLRDSLSLRTSLQPRIVCCSYGLMQFQRKQPPKKLPLSRGDLGPQLGMVPWADPCPQPERHLDRFSRFSTAHGCDEQTDRQTDRPRYVCSNRPHLCTPRMRCGPIARLFIA